MSASAFGSLSILCFLLLIVVGTSVSESLEDEKLSWKDLLLLRQILTSSHFDELLDYAADMDEVKDGKNVFSQTGNKAWYDDNNLFDGHELASRQHWSVKFRPGGKRSDMNEDPESNSIAGEEAKLWLLSKYLEGREDGGLGGKSPISANQHRVSKRQHWSKGLAPGGKRSVDMSDFDINGRRVVKRSLGMQEDVYKMEQPKPASSFNVDQKSLNDDRKTSDMRRRSRRSYSGAAFGSFSRK